MEFTPDSRHFIAATHTGAAVYELPEWRLVAELDGHIMGFRQIAPAPHAPLLALPNDQQDQITIWDWRRRVEMATIESAPSELQFSSDGRFLAAHDHARMLVFSWDTSAERLVLSGHRAGTPSVAFSPGNARLASIGKDRMLRLWDDKNGRLIWETGPVPGFGQTVAFSPDGRLLATRSFSSSVVGLWEAATGRQLLELGTEVQTIESTWSARFSPNGQLLAVAAVDGIRVWKVKTTEPETGILTATAELTATCRGAFANPSFTANNSHVIAQAGYRARGGFESVVAWEFNKTAAAQPITQPLSASGFSYGHWQRICLTTGGNRCLVNETGSDVRMLELPSGKELRRMPIDPTATKQRGGVGCIALSPDETLLACAAPSQLDVELWNFRTGEFLYTLPDAKGTIWWLAWSPDSKRLAISGAGGEIEVWNLPGLARAMQEARLETE